ncbi:hypothetical protein NDA11_000622 [Ustilago hordei]|nr:hypothetical protein NDA11_000622 [Ustilago hordei]
MGMWEITNLPKDANTIDTWWVLKIKTDANLIPMKFKARLVAQGFTQHKGIDYMEVFTLPLNGIKIPGKVLKVVKGLYSLKQSGHEWNIELDSHLQMIGFHCMPSTPCLYSRGTDDRITIITAYIDDMLIMLPSCSKVNHTKQEIMDKWEMKDNGKIKEFLGIKITCDRRQRRISLDLTAYVKAMVNKWLEGTNEKSWIPMLSVANMVRGKKCNPQQARKCQELVSQLFAWKAAIHKVKYLNQTSGYQLYLGGRLDKHADKPVTTYTNANWALDPTNGWRSTSGVIMYIYRCPVSWKSHVQKCVVLSAVKAEFFTASEAVQEVLFFSYLLQDLEITDVQPMLYTDSQGCIQDWRYHQGRELKMHWHLKRDAQVTAKTPRDRMHA